LLKNFELPPEKAPLFVGGTGFVVEKDEGKLVGRIYPVNPRSETIFWYTDGEIQSRISMDLQDWDKLKVTEPGQGEAVAVEMVRHAWQFEMVPGRNYEIR